MPNKGEPLTPCRKEHFSAILWDAFKRSGYLQPQLNSRKEY